MLNLTRHSSVLLMLFACAVAATSRAAHAEELTCKPTQIFYVNGVWNPTESDADDSAVELRNAMTEAGFEPGTRPRVIHNPGDGGLADVAEVLISQNWWRSKTEFFAGFMTAFHPYVGAYLQSQLNEVAANERNRRTIEKIKSIILVEIRDRKNPVVIVAHSQGNILVNRAVHELQFDPVTGNIPGMKSIGVIGVGVADKYKAGAAHAGGETPYYRYITSTRDLIITPLIGVLSPNFKTDLSDSAGDFTDHLFADTYLGSNYHGLYSGDLARTTARAKVPQLLREVYDTMQASWPCGAISISANPALIGQEFTVKVSLTNRPHYAGQFNGTAYVTELNGSQLCEGPIGSSRPLSCSYTDRGVPRLAELRAFFYNGEAPHFSTHAYPIAARDLIYAHNNNPLAFYDWEDKKFIVLHHDDPEYAIGVVGTTDRQAVTLKMDGCDTTATYSDANKPILWFACPGAKIGKDKAVFYDRSGAPFASIDVFVRPGRAKMFGGFFWATDPIQVYSFAEGANHCKNLAMSGLTWRLPTLEELTTAAHNGLWRHTWDELGWISNYQWYMTSTFASGGSYWAFTRMDYVHFDKQETPMDRGGMAMCVSEFPSYP